MDKVKKKKKRNDDKEKKKNDKIEEFNFLLRKTNRFLIHSLHLRV